MSKVHIWKPEPDRWVIIDTHTGQLFDVGRSRMDPNRYVVFSTSVVPKDIDVAKIVESYEELTKRAVLLAPCVLDFEVT